MSKDGIIATVYADFNNRVTQAPSRKLDGACHLFLLEFKGKIEISIPKTTQAEVYAILRVGRMKFKFRDGGTVNLVPFTNL